MNCDFCYDPSPMWEYGADSFFDLCVSQSVGAWLACDECHAVIEAGDREGLVKRAMLNPSLRAAQANATHVLEYVRDLHDRFFGARRRPARWLACSGRS